MKRSLSLGHLSSIPIELSYSAFLIQLSLTVLMAFIDQDVLGFPLGFGHLSLSAGSKLLLGAACAAIIFFGILLHELAHCYMAKKIGYTVRKISISFIGGESDIQERYRYGSSKGEIAIVLIGPAVNLALGGVLLSIAYLSGDGADQSVLMTFVSVLGFYNIILGAFNLLPGDQLDGGRILRLVLGKRMDVDKTIMTSIKIYRGIAVVLGIYGLLIGNVNVVVIAAVLYIAAYIEDPDFYWRTE